MAYAGTATDQVLDVDGDGSEELFMAWQTEPFNPQPGDLAGLRTFDLATSAMEVDLAAGYRWVPTVSSVNPILADTDGDGSVEVYHCYVSNDGSTHIQGYDLGGEVELFSRQVQAFSISSALPDMALVSSPLRPQGPSLYSLTHPAAPLTGQYELLDPLTGAVLHTSPLLDHFGFLRSHVGDIDGDGDSDLVYQVINWTNNTQYLRAVDLTTDQQLFRLDFSADMGGLGELSFASVVLVDLDGDGAKEVVLFHWDQALARFIWSVFEGDGQLRWSSTLLSNGGTWDATKDHDGDGILDVWSLAMPVGEVMVLSGINGSEIARYQRPAGYPCCSVPTYVDVEGDGAVESLMWGYDVPGDLYPLELNDGDGQRRWGIDAPGLSLSGGGSSKIVSAQLDADAAPEVVFPWWNPNSGLQGVLIIDSSDGTIEHPLAGWEGDGTTKVELLDLPVLGPAPTVGVVATFGGALALGLVDPVSGLTSLTIDVPGAVAWLKGGDFDDDGRSEVLIDSSGEVHKYTIDFPPTQTFPWPQLTLDEDVPLLAALQPASYFTDDTPPSALTFSVGTGPFDGGLTPAVNGSVIDLLGADPDWSGSTSFTLVVDDGANPPQVTDPINVTILPVNDAPRWGALQPRTIDEDSLLEVPLPVTDVEGDALTLGTTLPGAMVQDGTLRWTPTDGEVGVTAIGLWADDGHGGNATATLEVQVDNTNDPPHFRPPRTVGGIEEQTLSFRLQADDPDLPFGDALRYGCTDERVEVDPILGIVAVAFDDVDLPQVQLHFTVTDLQDAQDDLTLTIDVAAVNDVPTLVVAGPSEVDQGHTATFLVQGTDADADATLTYHVQYEGGAAPPLTLDPTSGEGVWVPTNAQVGPHRLQFWAYDGAGGSSMVEHDIKVRNVNDPPTLVVRGPHPDSWSLQVGVPWQVQLFVDDPDLVHGDSLSLFTDEPDAALQRPSAQRAVLQWTPGAADVGATEVSVTVRDLAGVTATLTLNLSVEPQEPGELRVQILVPSSGAVVPPGRLMLRGTASIDDAAVEGTLVWFIDGQEVGRGPRTTATVERGAHLVRLEAQVGSQHGDATVHIDVKGASVQTSPPLQATLLPLAAVLIVALLLLLVALGRRRRGRGAPAAPLPPPPPLAMYAGPAAPPPPRN